MLGSTPPSAMVALCSSLLSSQSFLMASRMCLGTILVFLLSLAAFPASSSTSAARYSSTAARQTGAPAPTRSVQCACLSSLPTLPTGNCSPALEDLETAFDEVVLALPDFPPFPAMFSLQARQSLHFQLPNQTACNPANQFIALRIPGANFSQSNIKPSLLWFVALPQHRAAVAHAARLLLFLLLQHLRRVVDAGIQVVVGGLEEGGLAEVFGALVGGRVGAEVLELVTEEGHQQEAEDSGQQTGDDHVGEIVLVAVLFRDGDQSAGLQRRQRLEVEVDADEHDLHGAEDEQYYEGGELADVVGADAVVDPRTVVVVTRDAPPADEAVELGRPDVAPALGTKGQLHLQQVLGRLLGVLAGEQEVEHHHQQVEEAGQRVEAEVGVLAEEVHLHQQVGGQVDDVEEQQEEHALLHRGPLHLVHDLHVAGDLHPLAVRKLVVQDPRHLALPQLPRQVDCPLLLQVGDVPVDSLQQHALDDLLVPSADRQHQRRPALVVAGVYVGALEVEEVGGEVGEPVLGGLVEDGVSGVVGFVDAEGDLSLAVLEEVDGRLEVVVLGAHEEDVLLLVGLRLHVGPVALEELDHLDVTVQGREVQGGEAVGVLGVDPGPELALEGGGVLVALVEGLVVQDVDLHLGELVLEGGEVQQRRLVLLLHDGQVQLLPRFEVVTQVLVGFEAHDETNGLAVAGRLLPCAHVIELQQGWLASDGLVFLLQDGLRLG